MAPTTGPRRTPWCGVRLAAPPTVTITREHVLILGLASTISLISLGCGSVTLSSDGGADGAPDLAIGSGGAAGTGGVTGSGGVSGTGGTEGTGGAIGSGGAGGTGGASGTGGTGGAAGHDECQRDADCPTITCIKAPCPVAVCVLSTDGFHYCVARQDPAPDACPDFAPQCCTSSAQCTLMPHGTCVPQRDEFCGGPVPIGNDCRYDACQGDADCTAEANGICTAGFPRQCLYGPCRKNADCAAGPGGTCVLDTIGLYCRTSAVFCRYANDPCHANADCTGQMQACVPNANGQGAACQTQPPPPP